VEKLPTQIKVDWPRFKATKSNITLKLLADWLYNLAEIVCTVTVPSSTRTETKKEKEHKKVLNEYVK